MRPAVLAALALCLVLAGCGGGLSRAEYEHAAESGIAARDRQSHLASAQLELAALRTHLPGLDWGPHASDELCDLDLSGHTTFGSPPPDSLACRTSVVQYTGFDGDLPAAIRRLDDSLTAAGWTRGTTDVNMPINYYQWYKGRPEGPRTYDAGSLPGLYYTAAHTTACAAQPQPWSLAVTWLEAGQPLGPGQYTVSRYSTTDTPFYQHRDPLDRSAAALALLATHHYVTVLVLSLRCVYTPTDLRN
ncbi:ABC-type amino acid transport substrate-binding protein [Kutzneria viridogrisea]|uniref:ABC-type amino acid transport substrate-binding protein n=1 Tax=Kutzneria viridogrisea TaxID=47990 RepID=A0ABR6BAL4_9PSEU|nr:ABC-type amino acid transport substrate-binding protein [Kutzneria viridogrisea]